eukprot:TRINITY_DN28863_c0_g1_i1.p1 TRINITY_DN28863_c0_g1~~TRINITY_DN28863_c0_g1_i1.p1  ORF type:complete len:101 (-),score=27.70 TRINITY_DN28863_c0_g1_i1:228-494(-)
MPGKQMAIDADLNAGFISAEQARDRREEATREADFYGSMDGASKFVKGDAIAGIVILISTLLVVYCWHDPARFKFWPSDGSLHTAYDW